MGWDRQKPFVMQQPTPPAVGRWLLAAVLIAIVCVLLFSLHAANRLSVLQSINIWLLSLAPLVGWGLVFCVRGYLYGRALSHYEFLQDEAQYAQQEWQAWADRYMAVLASCVLLPDAITVLFLASEPKDLQVQNGLVRRIDYLPDDEEPEYPAIRALLASIDTALNALPAERELRVTVLTDAEPERYAALQETFAQCWESIVLTRPAPATLSLTDEMPYGQLESRLKNATADAELILVLQLQGGEEYSDGLAVLLLVTDDVARTCQLAETGRLLRPMPLNVPQADSELALFMTTQSLACRAGGILGDSQQLMSLTPSIIPIGNAAGANFSASSVQIQEEWTGRPGPFSAWLVAALGLDFARYHGVPYVVFSLTPGCEVVSTVSPGVRNEDVE
ncbi:conserved hypothetical protein [Enterobacterales bacterium 8AC]|nr:conserved hypothetical protein [Enterobacterales bacterium 8AC]